MRFPGPGDPVAGLHNTSCVFVCALVCVLMFYTDSAHKCTLCPDSAHPDAWLGGRVGHKMIFGF